MKILMVCLGNICRSPLAEGILRDKLNKLKSDHFIDSAGMLSYHAGEPPDARSIAVAEKHGIDISGQTARQFSKKDFEKFDLILAMDYTVYEEIISFTDSEKQKAKVHLYLDFAEWNDKVSEVPDPYYGGSKDFEEVFKLLDEASEKIVNKLLKNY
jgi:protein-tyrosine phosphatase